VPALGQLERAVEQLSTKSIFRKLGVSARDEAVGRARELGLL
jgi:hypothetical protein